MVKGLEFLSYGVRLSLKEGKLGLGENLASV